MGSPHTDPERARVTEFLHRRRIPRSFAVATKAVTVEEWRRFLKERQERDSLPSRIEQLEADIQSLYRQMAEPSYYQQLGEQIAESTARLKRWEEDLATAYQRWEELDELAAALSTGESRQIQEEVGDLLLACASLARHCRVDPEEALRQACRKFEARFTRVEDKVRAGGLDWRDLGEGELDRLWEQAKRAE